MKAVFNYTVAMAVRFIQKPDLQGRVEKHKVSTLISENSTVLGGGVEKMSESPVTEFYNGKNVFVTGVTGFLAKAVVEKLLRLTDVNRIYVLIREKRGKSIKTRLDEVKKNLVFERLNRVKGESILDKLIPIAGDVGVNNLGLSETDKKILCSEVHIVFHSAATLDFELNAKLVVNINLLGTRRVLELCSQMNHLQAFVYVSTAYVNSDKAFAIEKLYPKPGNVDDFMGLLKMSDEEADKTLAKMMNGHINSYTISKALAEHEVNGYAGRFPSAVVRPSMIVGAWKEPAPGWTDSKNGPTGFFMGAGMGIIRRLPVNRDMVYDYIPVDVVTNELVVAGWHVGTKRPQELQIYHCTSSTTKPFCWNLIDQKINTLLTSYPLKSAVWYPTIKLHHSFTLFRISTIFLHFLPGFFFDLLLRLFGKKPMLLKLHYKVDSSLCRLAPFIFKEWFFDSTNTDKLYDSLTELDRNTYNLNIRSINYSEFFEDAVIGVRRYLYKEKDETLAAARKKVKIFYVLNCLMQVVFVVGVWWLAAQFLHANLLSCFWALPVVYFLFSLL